VHPEERRIRDAYLGYLSPNPHEEELVIKPAWILVLGDGRKVFVDGFSGELLGLEEI
jgi:hypothetical protein